MTNVQEIKDKAKATWATGSYDSVATYLAPMSAHLVRAAGIRAGERVLDVATGTGVTAITAARAGARVTGLDLTPELLSVAKEHADLAGATSVEWKQGDAEDLPFQQGEFDAVLSSFGHVFAPRPDVVAKEIVRVAKSGGRVAFVTHTPENVVARLFAAQAQHVPPPQGVPSPMQWGAPETIRERLGESLRDLVIERGHVDFPMLSPEHFWRLFSTTYGPTMKVMGALANDRAKVDALRRDWVAAVAPFWRDNVIRLDYVLARGVKR